MHGKPLPLAVLVLAILYWAALSTPCQAQITTGTRDGGYAREWPLRCTTDKYCQIKFGARCLPKLQNAKQKICQCEYGKSLDPDTMQCRAFAIETFVYDAPKIYDEYRDIETPRGLPAFPVDWECAGTNLRTSQCFARLGATMTVSISNAFRFVERFQAGRPPSVDLLTWYCDGNDYRPLLRYGDGERKGLFRPVSEYCIPFTAWCDKRGTRTRFLPPPGSDAWVKCDCRPQFTGSRCDKLRPSTEAAYREVTGIRNGLPTKPGLWSPRVCVTTEDCSYGEWCAWPFSKQGLVLGEQGQVNKQCVCKSGYIPGGSNETAGCVKAPNSKVVGYPVVSEGATRHLRMRYTPENPHWVSIIGLHSDVVFYSARSPVVGETELILEEVRSVSERYYVCHDANGTADPSIEPLLAYDRDDETHPDDDCQFAVNRTGQVSSVGSRSGRTHALHYSPSNREPIPYRVWPGPRKRRPRRRAARGRSVLPMTGLTYDTTCVFNPDDLFGQSECWISDDPVNQDQCNSHGVYSTSFGCVCDTGWYGSDCSYSSRTVCGVDECVGNGECAPGAGGCNCFEGFFGSTCKITAEACRAGRCNDKGNCTGQLNGCACERPWGGDHCTVNLCAPHGTYNASTNECDCTAAWQGDECQFKACGFHGRYNSTTEACDCRGYSRPDYTATIADGICSAHVCGAHASLSTRLQGQCKCPAGFVAVANAATEDEGETACRFRCNAEGTIDGKAYAAPTVDTCECKSTHTGDRCAERVEGSSSSSSDDETEAILIGVGSGLGGAVVLGAAYWIFQSRRASGAAYAQVRSGASGFRGSPSYTW